MKISVVMTSYNYAEYISEAIESVINQTYTDWELVIVDDGSKDDSLEIIKKYQKSDKRIKLFQHKNGKNKGLAASLKLGIEKAESDWIAFLESDDCFHLNSLEEKVRVIEELNPDLLFTDVNLFQDRERINYMSKHLQEIQDNYTVMNESGFIDDFSTIIREANIIPTFSVVILKKTNIAKCDFSSPFKASLDYFLWNQFQNSRVYYLHKKLTNWRMHKDSYINQDKHSWISRYIFHTRLYYFTIQNKSLLKRIFLILDYMRKRIIYLRVNKQSIKLNLFSEKFIFEKSWK
ncbi:MAG: glycosyltransferase [Candidatus Gastranaerophilales bacterium]|nr:glycosyltransferase [Candidatus Gastranaerophilales bacterium]MCM1072892.1 glycosyltransferase [Bacteroides sp.]